MKKISWLLLFSLSLWSCTKMNDISNQNDSRSSGNLPKQASFTSVSSKFGLLVGKSYDSGINTSGFPRVNLYGMSDINEDAWAYDTMKVKYLRLAVNQDNWNLPNPAGANYRNNFLSKYRTAYDKGLSILLNCNYWGPSNSNKDYPDSTTYKTWLKKVLDSCGTRKPALVVVENEECGGTYDNSTPAKVQAYVNELKGGATQCRSYGIAVTNGGMTNFLLGLLVFDSYRPDTAKANGFARKVFAPTTAAQVIGGTYNSRINRWRDNAFTSSGYGSCGLTYVNMHWYEPAYLATWNDTNDGSPSSRFPDSTSGQLNKIISYCKTSTGITTAVSNEVGQDYNSVCLTNDYVSELDASAMPIVCWYDGDGDGQYDAKALHNTTLAGVAKIRPTGVAFRSWMAGTGSTCF